MTFDHIEAVERGAACEMCGDDEHATAGYRLAYGEFCAVQLCFACLFFAEDQP
jgi:hypothetical protein